MKNPPPGPPERPPKEEIESAPSVTLALKSSQAGVLFPLLQKGVWIRTRLGCSVRELLTARLGIDPEYLARRVQTVFLDGKVVDDLDRTLVDDGASLTLSAAMPGLAGAVLRGGGFFSPLRSTLSYRETRAAGRAEDGLLRIKLFNLLIPELGPLLLDRGVLILRVDYRQIQGALERASSPAGENQEPDPGKGASSGKQERGDWVELRVSLQT